MAKIQELLQGRDEKIDYDDLIKRHPWILQKNQQCILSPDSDGLLCGLFMSHMLNWQIKGFYDGKVMVLEKEVSKETLEKFLKMLSLFCPHISEELWEKLGNKGFVSLAKWPEPNEKLINEEAEYLEDLINWEVNSILEDKCFSSLRLLKSLAIASLKLFALSISPTSF